MKPPLKVVSSGNLTDQTDIRDANGRLVSMFLNADNAALIVRAVNSHQALIDALEKIVDIGALAEPEGFESFTDEQKKLYPIIYSEEAHVAIAALKLAKGES